MSEGIPTNADGVGVLTDPSLLVMSMPEQELSTEDAALQVSAVLYYPYSLGPTAPVLFQ